MEKYLPTQLYNLIGKESDEKLSNLTEIRIRNNRPVIFYIGAKEYAISEEGGLISGVESGFIAERGTIKKCVELISGYSLYAWEDELKCGFITLPGGHRVGLCGKIVVEDGNIKTMTNISSLNIRITHEVKGCSDLFLDKLILPDLNNTMIISPPGCGKTTFLRDLVRNISNGIPLRFRGQTVGLVDERSEIAGSYLGIPQNDVGIRTDVLDRCPKHKGMVMLLRSMAPKIIAADEIGSAEDIKAIEDIVNAGVKFICTVHGDGISDIKNKENLSRLINEKTFKRYVVMSAKNRPGEVVAIYNENFEEVM